MPLHPLAAEALERMRAGGWQPRRTLTPQEARLQAKRLKVPSLAEPLLAVVERGIPGPADQMRIRVYRPSTGALPVLMFFHGGGWVLGDLDTSDNVCRRVAKEVDCLVVSVEYRLAPEHPFPAGLEDCYAATCWVAGASDELTSRPGPVAVSGISAGGNLAAAVSLKGRDEGGPDICHQLLVCPSVDVDFDRPSYIDNAEGYMLERGDMIWFWEQYVGCTDNVDPYAAPMLAESLHDLPTCHLITSEFDPLRDEGAAYASRLQEADVCTTYRCCEGMLHGGVLASPIPAGREAFEETCRLLRESFTSPSTNPRRS